MENSYVIFMTKNLEEIHECLTELTISNKEVTKIMEKLLKAVNKNTYSNLDLKNEVKIARQVDEDNRLFLQQLIKDLLTESSKTENKKWDLLIHVLNWALKIGAFGIITAMGIKVLFPGFGA